MTPTPDPAPIVTVTGYRVPAPECPACDDARCNRFTDDCRSDHIPVTDVRD